MQRSSTKRPVLLDGIDSVAARSYSDGLIFFPTTPFLLSVFPSPSTDVMANRKLRIRRLDEQRSNDDLDDHTPAECMEMVWPLTQQAWAFKQVATSTEKDNAQPRLQRHAVRLRRRGGQVPAQSDLNHRTSI